MRENPSSVFPTRSSTKPPEASQKKVIRLKLKIGRRSRGTRWPAADLSLCIYKGENTAFSCSYFVSTPVEAPYEIWIQLNGLVASE